MHASAAPLVFPDRTPLYPEVGVPEGVFTAEQAARVIPRRCDLVTPSVEPDPATHHLLFFLQQVEIVPRRDVRFVIAPASERSDQAVTGQLLEELSSEGGGGGGGGGGASYGAGGGGGDGGISADEYDDPAPADELDPEVDNEVVSSAAAEKRREEWAAERAARKARAARWARAREDVVILSGVTQEGVSVAVQVRNFRPAAFLMPSVAMAERDPGLHALRRLVAQLDSDVRTEVTRLPRAYGYHPDPANPAERVRFPFLRFSASSQFKLSWICRVLEGALLRGETLEALMKGRPVTRELAGALEDVTRLGGATVEEGSRLKADFKFLDSRQIPPASWVVVRRRGWKKVSDFAPRFSLRSLNAVATSPDAVWPLDALIANPRAAAALASGLTMPLPDTNAVPPSLFAYCDIEARSHAADEFPDPNHPAAPCYMVGISAVWAFSLPPAFMKQQAREGEGEGADPTPSLTQPSPAVALRPAGSGNPANAIALRARRSSTPSPESWLASEERRVTEGAEQEKERRRQEVRQARQRRLEARARRVAKYSNRADVLTILSGGEPPLSCPSAGGAGAGSGSGSEVAAPSPADVAALMNSDDESEGEEVVVRAAEAEADGAKRAEVERLRAQAAGLVWEKKAAGRGAAASLSPGAMLAYPCVRLLLVVGSCDPIPGACVVTFPDERSLLRWLPVALFGLLDVDGIRGYNWLGFDTRYLVRRAQLHGVGDAALRWSHLPSRPPSFDQTETELKIAKGIFKMVRLHGTNTVDMMIYMKQQLDLSSYKLDAIAEHFGIHGKHPIKPEHIFAACDGTPRQRAIVGAYCLQDCDVLAAIARASLFEVTISQFARIMQTQPEVMWTSGQQVRVVHQLIWQAHRRGFVVDGLFRNRDREDTALRTLASGKSFSGGFVMKPAVAHYRTPTATLDYKSLYPSIMISHKLCFSTALLAPYDSPPWVERIEAAGLEVIRIDTESGCFHYVQHPVNMIPDMEWTLWTSRQAIKKEMKRVTDALVRAVLDAQQLAVKVSMNATFGITGAEHAMLGMKRIAASITHVGRNTVQQARDFANGLSGGGGAVAGAEGDAVPTGAVPAAEDTSTFHHGTIVRRGGQSHVLIRVPPVPGAEPSLLIPALQEGVHLLTVYGDTDSIMVNLPDKLHPVAHAWAESYIARLLGEEEEGESEQPSTGSAGSTGNAGSDESAAASGSRRHAARLLLVCRYVGEVITEALNTRYRKPMEIEFEEVASNAIFLAPKMYTKNVVEDMSDPVVRKLAGGGTIGKIKVAGIAAKRRDRSLVTKRLQKGAANAVVHEGNDARALLLTRRWVTRLATCELSAEDYVITTELKNPNERVGQAVQPHVAVAWALEHKCRGSEPVKGERVPWLLVRTPDPSRLVPPDTKRTNGRSLILPVRTRAELAAVPLSALVQAMRQAKIATAVPRDMQRLKFGDRDLSLLHESATLGDVGIQHGHRIEVHKEGAAATAKPVQFRVFCEEEEEDDDDEDEGGMAAGSGDEEEGSSTSLSSSSASNPPRSAAASRASVAPASSSRDAMAMMMFHAKEMTAAQRKAMGKRGAATSEKGLSPFARHPVEVEATLAQEIDGRRYMGHVRSALEILFSKTRPDLWSSMKRTLAMADPILDVAQGKPRQTTLAGFISRAGAGPRSGGEAPQSANATTTAARPSPTTTAARPSPTPVREAVSSTAASGPAAGVSPLRGPAPKKPRTAGRGRGGSAAGRGGAAAGQGGAAAGRGGGGAGAGAAAGRGGGGKKRVSLLSMMADD